MVKLRRSSLALTSNVIFILLSIVGVVFVTIDVRFWLMVDLRIVDIVVTLAVIAATAHRLKTIEIKSQQKQFWEQYNILVYLPKVQLTLVRCPSYKFLLVLFS